MQQGHVTWDGRKLDEKYKIFKIHKFKILKIHKSTIMDQFPVGVKKSAYSRIKLCYWLDAISPIRANMFLEKENEKSVSGM